MCDSSIVKLLLSCSSVSLDEVVDKQIAHIISSLQKDHAQTCEQIKVFSSLIGACCDNFSSKHADAVLHKVCLPLLRELSVQGSSTANHIIIGELCKIVKLCFHKLDEGNHCHLLDLCIHSLDGTQDELGRDDRLSLQIAIELTGCLLPASSDFAWKDLVFTKTLTLIKESDDQILSQILRCIISKILPKDGESSKVREQLKSIWDLIVSIGNKTSVNGKNEDHHDNSSKQYLLMCSLADQFLPLNISDGCFDLIRDDPFWSLLQTGFYSRDALARKRVLYLLKRILEITVTDTVNSAQNVPDSSSVPLFWWDEKVKKDLSDMWNDYVLLLETLEEKQVHVIKPTLPRIKNLEKATGHREQGWPLLHTSWLVCLYRRMARHESTFIMRWGVERLLQTDLTACPMLQQGQQQFLHGELVTILTESSVFYKPPEFLIGSCSPAGGALRTFFTNCYKALSSDAERATFFKNFIQEMTRHHWGGSALVYITQALADLPTCPVFDQSSLFCIRDLLTKSLRTIEVHLRGAVQCFLLRVVIKLTDRSKVDPGHIFSIFALLKSDESFKRGTQSWKETVDWLIEAVSSDSTNQNWTPVKLREHLELSMSHILKSDKTHVFSDADQIVRTLVLCADADVIPKKQSDSDCPLVSLITPAVAIVTSVNTRAYMSHGMADMALHVLSRIAEEAENLHVNRQSDQSQTEPKPDLVSSNVASLLSACMSEITLYLQRRATQLMNSMRDVSSLPLYTRVIKILGRWIQADVFQANMKPLISACCQICSVYQPKPVSEEKQIRQLACFSVLSAFCAISIGYRNEHQRSLPEWTSHLSKHLQTMEIIHVFEKPEIKQQTDHSVSAVSVQWGQLASDFLTAEWTCLYWYLLNHHETAPVDSHCYHSDHCLESLNVCGAETLPSIFGCLRILLPKQKADPEKIMGIFEIAWSKTFEETKAACFWDIFEGLVHMMFQPAFLCEEEGSVIHTHLHQFAERIFALGDEKNGVVNVLASRLCHIWQNQTDFCHAIKHIDIIVNAVVFGTVHLKGIKYSSEVSAYIATLGSDCSVNDLVQSNARDDSLVRVHIMSLLANLSRDDAVHVNFAKSVFESLQQKERTLVAQKSYRNFTNSFNHRQKHRTLTAMLLLEPFLISQETMETAFTFAFEILETENQPSVRCQLEWLILRLVCRVPKFAEKVWMELSRTSEKKSAYVCSLLSMISHLGPAFPERQQQESLYMKAIRCVLPWCMAHHFNTRVFAEATLIALWGQCTSAGFTSVTDRFSVVDAIIAYHHNNSNALKSTQKLLENFFFTFDPVRDYSIETIFRTLPYLTSVTDEEWLSWQLFTQVDTKWQHGQPGRIALRNSSTDLAQCNPGNWRMKPPGVDGDGGESAEGDVQKKMMPWRCMLPEADLDLTEEYTKKRQRQVGQLILVTTLIDKIPNLGGLCRTSEIFGVSEFIVGNIKNIDDKNFQSLSVTAHKWIPIKEVRPWFLKDYLMEIRGKGYTLVGAEQTANSRCLTDYTFPVKTLLLLGNEKEGLPVELIQLLDVCVEIPQQGFVRSLNVHVSGALLVWEYTRQQLLNLPAGGSS